MAAIPRAPIIKDPMKLKPVIPLLADGERTNEPCELRHNNKEVRERYASFGEN